MSDSFTSEPANTERNEQGWPCQRCGTRAGTIDNPFYGLPGEEVCIDCWNQEHSQEPGEPVTEKKGQAGMVPPQRSQAEVSRRPAPPSYLESVNNNVNRQVHEDYHDYISGCKEHGIILWRDEEQKYIFIPYYELGRYSEGGRKAISRKLKKALGRKNVRKGVFLTLTFAQTGVDLLSCWVNIGNEIRKFLNNVKMWKKRRGHKGSLDYFWIVEPHRGNNNYPHVHIFFPGLDYLERWQILKKFWKHGNIKPEKKEINMWSYMCKYLTKDGWNDEKLAYLRASKSRLYAVSKNLREKVEKAKSKCKMAGFYGPETASILLNSTGVIFKTNCRYGVVEKTVKNRITVISIPLDEFKTLMGDWEYAGSYQRQFATPF